MSSTERLELKKADLYGPMDNQAYALLEKAGVLDTIARPKDGGSLVFETAIYAISIGDAQVVTTPGALFPELFLGVARLRRKDCAAADNGSPLEPAIRDAMTAKFRFIFGLRPDELGYIVPGYDWRREPFDQQKMSMPQSGDACRAQGVPNHYHETNSASSVMAQASTCATVALLTGKRPADAACQTAGLYSRYVRSLK